MLRHIFFASCLWLLGTLTLSAEGGKSQIPLADPYILLDGDKYYAYGTHDASGIRCYSSDDLRSWKDEGQALNKANTTETQWFWAPEVYHIGDRYIMYYSANEHLFAATATSPKGPFKQVDTYQMNGLLGSEKCIDSSVFFDDDGTAWLFFVRFTDGNCIWQCKLSDDYITPVAGTLRKCFAASQSWELILGRVNEGPNIVKYNRRYYLTYSGNDYRSQDYAVGYATATSLTGSWTKYTGNPILRRWDDLVGTGHHSIFTDKEGILRIVFHAHNSTEEVGNRLMYIGTLQFSGSRLQMSNEPIIRPTLEKLPYNPEVIDREKGMDHGATTCVDLNNDGHLDIVGGGFGNTETQEAQDEQTRRRMTYVSLFGPSTHKWLSPSVTPPFRVADRPSLIPCDINNDGNMDIVAFENVGTDSEAEAYADAFSRQGIFLGRGNGTFDEATLVFSVPDGFGSFDTKGPCSADVIDIDNDGRLDIVCAGHQGTQNYNVILHNAGIDSAAGTIHFKVEPYETEFTFAEAIVQAADLNNDGFQDFALAATVLGVEGRSCFTDIYLNDTLSHGSFVRLNLGERGATFRPKTHGALQLADFNCDGWTDILLTGTGDAASGETAMRQRMYLNRKQTKPTFAATTNNFTADNFDVATSVQNAVGIFDWNGDGYFDIFLGGTPSGGQATSGWLYTNTSIGRPTRAAAIPGATSPTVIFPDWNGDGRKDYVATGLCTDANYLTEQQQGRVQILCYNLAPTPLRPDAPINPAATVQRGGVTLTWDAPETVKKTATYEIYITDSLGRQLNATPAFVGGDSDGVRKLNRTGRAGSTGAWTFCPTTAGTYHWGVQTVDAAYNGSTFTAGPAFTVAETDLADAIETPRFVSTDATRYYTPGGVGLPTARRGLNIIQDRNGTRKVIR